MATTALTRGARRAVGRPDHQADVRHRRPRPVGHNEGFTDDYDLPNETAYAETCASVGLVFWASRMLGLRPDGRYADIMEQALYNGALSGLSLDGTTFFYENPLESRGAHHRWTWHRCPCCPPNIARTGRLDRQLLLRRCPTTKSPSISMARARRRAARRSGPRSTLTQETTLSLGRRRHDHGRAAAPASFAPCVCAFPAGATARRSRSTAKPVDRRGSPADGYVRLRRDWQSGDTRHARPADERRAPCTPTPACKAGCSAASR